jgi:Tfp pilus assembly protein PilX
MKHLDRQHYTPTQTHRQNGVVLIVTMIMLVLISIASASAIRGATSSEAVTNHSRTQQLAMQAAEAALLTCERQTTTYLQGVIAASSPSSTATTPTKPFDIQDAPTPSGSFSYTYRWQDVTNVWDSTNSAVVTVLPLSLVNASSTNIFSAYRRPPECVVEMYEPGNNSRAVITARGFGPEVAANRGKPIGSEVWLQSIVQVSSSSP